MKDDKKTKGKAPKKRKMKKRWKFLLWLAILSPLWGIILLLFIRSYGDIPDFEALENPPTKLATEVISGDGEVIGKYFSQNRTNADYHEISPNVINALIATEDARFNNHSGIDLEATMRAVARLGKDGGGSTLTQQLALNLYGDRATNILERIWQKLGEWVTAIKLEQKYTKEEIMTMYLNTFDFLNNAVGINSASTVYFSKKPSELELHEAALLVGMLKNPAAYNPRHDIKEQKVIDDLLRVKDSLIKTNANTDEIDTKIFNKKKFTGKFRREVVLKQMQKAGYITEKQYDSVRVLPLDLNYSAVDHREGIAPYFREVLREEVSNLLNEKDENGNYKILNKETGKPYNVYTDGLKIYTTIDTRMQKYAEQAVEEHLKELQKTFDKYVGARKNSIYKNAPFESKVKKATIEGILKRAKEQTTLYKTLTGGACAQCERPKSYLKEIKEKGEVFYQCKICKHKSPHHDSAYVNKVFDTPVKTKVFDWKAEGYEKDTVLSPNQKIRYHKSILRTSLMAMEPSTGFIKAWVGGPSFKYFQYDMVKKGRRQVGSTFKPFVYATAIKEGVVSPCTTISNVEYCVEYAYNERRNRFWCPKNAGGVRGDYVSIKDGLKYSMNTVTAYVMKHTKPQNVAQNVSRMGIPYEHMSMNPSMALGTDNLSVFQMVGAINTFANYGVYIRPTFIIRIEDKYGKPIYQSQPKMKEVFDENTAYTTIKMMEAVTRSGTATRIRYNYRPYGGIPYPIAGKTGTTQDNTDGWFIGATPDLITGVWAGGEDNGVRFRSTAYGQGANMALPAWGYFMKKVYADKKLNISTKDFPAPTGVVDMTNCSLYGDNDNYVDPIPDYKYNDYWEYDPEEDEISNDSDSTQSNNNP